MTDSSRTCCSPSTAIVLVGTLIVFVWQYIRSNRKD